MPCGIHEYIGFKEEKEEGRLDGCVIGGRNGGE